jgi:hypothetical protein
MMGKLFSVFYKMTGDAVFYFATDASCLGLLIYFYYLEILFGLIICRRK